MNNPFQIIVDEDIHSRQYIFSFFIIYRWKYQNSSTFIQTCKLICRYCRNHFLLRSNPASRMMTLSFRHVPAGKVKILVSLCINTFTLYIAIMDELYGVLVNMFGNNQPRDTEGVPYLHFLANWCEFGFASDNHQTSHMNSSLSLCGQLCHVNTENIKQAACSPDCGWLLSQSSQAVLSSVEDHRHSPPTALRLRPNQNLI